MAFGFGICLDQLDQLGQLEIFVKDFAILEKKLDTVFKDRNLLTQAFIHRSYLNEHPDFHLGHNERLEFLGDAVIEFVVTEYLYEHYPSSPEGELTNWRASLVNAIILSEIARGLNFEEYLYLSRGEAEDRGKARQYILANVIEAFIGALYLDRGIETVRVFVGTYILTRLPEILEKKLWMDPKSRFQEEAQERNGVTPSYKVLGEEGPDHAKNFTVGIYLHDELVAKGSGLSKQEAQVDAAKKALEVKKW
ncbi:MAG: ribonuclease III [bacterium]|nr:ribonuclease III [bacterium]